MSKARILKSHVRGDSHAWFGSGGGVGDCPADHNLAALIFHLWLTAEALLFFGIDCL